MSETPISPLRQRMIEDMTVRKLGAATQRNYIRAVKALSEYLGRSPATATAEDLRRFQVRQSEAGAQPSAMNNTVTGLRFFFRVTLDRPEMGRHLTLVRQPRKLPNVLNEEEVVRLLEHASGVKYRAALGVDQVPILSDSLGDAWPARGAQVPVLMPIVLRVGKIATLAS